MSGPVPDSINWIGFLATVAGLFISGIGLLATFWQAREAKHAARAAESAANNAIARLQTRTRIGNLSSGIDRVRIIHSHILSDNLEAARSLFGFCSRDFKEVFYALDSSGQMILPKDIEQALKQISINLDDKRLTPTKKAALMKA